MNNNINNLVNKLQDLFNEDKINCSKIKEIILTPLVYKQSHVTFFSILFLENYNKLVNYILINNCISVEDLTTQLTDLAFRSENTGAIAMDANSTRFELELNEGSGAGAVKNDFTLNSITYNSPGPLPIFGVITAFTSMKKLKRKYKNQEKFIIN